MKRQAPKRRKDSAAPENVSMTSEVAVQTDDQVPERNNMPTIPADHVEIKTELPVQSDDSDEEMTQSAQDEEPYSIVDHGKRLLSVLESEFLTDVTILVGDEAIKCHSNIVSFASPKLAAILKEKEPRLPDVDPRLFRLLLQIIYGGTKISNKPDNMETLLEVGRVAKELQVKAAVAYCADGLYYKLDNDNLWPILDFADLIHDAKLIESGSETFRDNAVYILQAEAFLNCTGARIKSILRQETIYNVTEVQLFQACVAWANANPDEVESRRAALRSALRLVRFRTFSAEDFAKHVCPTGLLWAEDERDILRSCVTGENFMPEGFSETTDPRDPSQVMVLEVSSRGKRMALDKFPENTQTSFKLFVQKDIFIHGVKFLAFRLNLHVGDFYEENVCVTLQERCGPGGMIQSNEASFQGQVKMGDMIGVKFKYPIKIPIYGNGFSLHFAYHQEDENDPAYDLYIVDKIRCRSGLKISVANKFLAPPCLHLIVADILPS